MASPRKLDILLPFPPFANKETQFTKGGIAYTPKLKKEYMLMVSEYLSDEHGGSFEGVICIKVTFIFLCPRPNAKPSHIPNGLWRRLISYYKPSKPDIDNFLKPLQDSISKHVIKKSKNKFGIIKRLWRGACIIDDDSNIVDLRAIKLYCRPDQEPSVIIKLKELPYTYERSTKSKQRDSGFELSSD